MLSLQVSTNKLRLSCGCKLTQVMRSCISPDSWWARVFVKRHQDISFTKLLSQELASVVRVWPQFLLFVTCVNINCPFSTVKPRPSRLGTQEGGGGGNSLEYATLACVAPKGAFFWFEILKGLCIPVWNWIWFLEEANFLLRYR